MSSSVKAVGAGSSADWSNAPYITADDSLYAYTYIYATSYSGYIFGNTCGFNIPTGATILGISVKINAKADAVSALNLSSVRLIDAGGSYRGSIKSNSTLWGTSDVDYIIGSSSDLWSASWLPSNINGNLFGVGIVVHNSSGNMVEAFIDYVEITVYYTPVIIVTYAMAMSYHIVRQINRIIAWTMSMAWTITVFRIFYKTIAFIMGMSISIIKLPKKMIFYIMNISETIIKQTNRFINWSMGLTFGSGFFRRTLSAINSFIINGTRINSQGILYKIINYVIEISHQAVKKTIRTITWIISMTWSIIATVVIPKIVEFIMSMSFSVSKLPMKVATYIINMSFNRVIKTIRTITYQMAMSLISLPFFLYKKTITFVMTMAQSMSYVILHILFKVVNFRMGMSFRVNTSARMFYLYWSRIFNPDILGYKIYEATNPYGVWVLKDTVTNYHYIRSLLIPSSLWIKIVPYTSRGELGHVILKGIKYG